MVVAVLHHVVSSVEGTTTEQIHEAFSAYMVSQEDMAAGKAASDAAEIDGLLAQLSGIQASVRISCTTLKLTAVT